ncbi:MAG: YggS family pyridoxal phosphate-dependent enzyme [Caldicoprobacterales bacterium]|jgi:pyridoxal phosphate enzyme (YggS family)|nr:YggS family pyridoxal phosphate-dependent enzyme [Clostridiales bacterium]
MNCKMNIDEVRQRIRHALLTAGRQPDDITLIGVTKNVDLDVIQKAVAHGIDHLGENRVQELLSKYDHIKNVNWHMIGRLQRNKVKYIIDKAAMIHSLDSLSLAKEINRQAEKAGRVVPVLVQVNPANEKTKSGLPYEEVIPFIETVYPLKYIRVMGLMLIAPFADNPETVRPYFVMMKQLYDCLKQYDYPHTKIQYLSMGMTNDFEIAIEEGSNMVRIGTALFGNRKKGEEINGRQVHE